MTSKCVHKGCGKEFADPDEPCVYHPGPPVFHEGQKGWKCCKPRVLTFDEFLTIPPCTTGKHSTVDETPKEEPQKIDPAAESLRVDSLAPKVTPISSADIQRTASPAIAPPSNAGTPAPPEDESDDPSLEIPSNAICRRRGCNETYDPQTPRDEETCTHHPGQPIFHEGSKGWSCCKRRVLEFDEFMKIPGCNEKKRHLFVGKGKPAGEEKVNEVRTDFYQTSSTVNASVYFKKIDKARAKISFANQSVDLDLPTSDNKRFTQTLSLFAPIDPEKSSYTVLGTKLELKLAKADGASWPVLRSEDKWTGQRIQIGNPGRA